MMKKLLVLVSIIPLLCIAQKQGNIWYFGKQVGLDFNSGYPAVITNGQTYSPDGTSVEGTAIISDSSGTFLFYTNGMKIWNRNQQVMPNGDNLMGSFSSTQSALILPQPSSSRYFYVFTTDCFQNNLQNGLRYSVVDICLDSGSGDVIPNQKNIKLLDTVAEKVTAVRHANGIDYWIITHKYYSDAFYSYHLSSTGIIDTVISHIGSRHPDIASNQQFAAAIGELKASPNGNKLAIVNGNAGAYVISEYFDFDKNTGAISNWINLQTNLAWQQQYYGISFSPDNSKLYIACSVNHQGVYQFNLNAGNGNADSVIASRTNIATNNIGYYGLQLANNGKIYITKTGINMYLAIINNPNNPGVNCNFQDSAIYLNGDTCGFGLPNFIDSYNYSNTIDNCIMEGVNGVTISNTFSISPNPFSSQTNITFNKETKHTTIKIMDMLGKVIKTKNFTGKQLTIEKGDMQAGVYFVQVIDEKKNVVNRKIVIQ